MLEMRPDCERCGRDLPAQDPGALICSFECTFCKECGSGPLKRSCPNCGGVLEARPARSKSRLERHPASTIRKGPK